jgi:Trp operon repressor
MKKKLNEWMTGDLHCKLMQLVVEEKEVRTLLMSNPLYKKLIDILMSQSDIKKELLQRGFEVSQTDGKEGLK